MLFFHPKLLWIYLKPIQKFIHPVPESQSIFILLYFSVMQPTVHVNTSLVIDLVMGAQTWALSVIVVCLSKNCKQTLVITGSFYYFMYSFFLTFLTEVQLWIENVDSCLLLYIDLSVSLFAPTTAFLCWRRWKLNKHGTDDIPQTTDSLSQAKLHLQLPPVCGVAWRHQRQLWQGTALPGRQRWGDVLRQ